MQTRSKITWTLTIRLSSSKLIHSTLLIQSLHSTCLLQTCTQHPLLSSCNPIQKCWSLLLADLRFTATHRPIQSSHKFHRTMEHNFTNQVRFQWWLQCLSSTLLVTTRCLQESWSNRKEWALSLKGITACRRPRRDSWSKVRIKRSMAKDRVLSQINQISLIFIDPLVLTTSTYPSLSISNLKPKLKLGKTATFFNLWSHQPQSNS